MRLGRRHIAAGLFALAMAGPATAEGVRPAPDYFVFALFSTSMADTLAQICGELALDQAALQAVYDDLDVRLTADGFDNRKPFQQMEDMTGQVHQLQSEFLDKHPIDGASPEEACAAARSEIADGSEIGTLLKEEPA
jgi:hypothetical protein